LLERELERLGAGCLLVLASEPGETDLAPFVGTARLGEAFLVARRGGEPQLAYWTPMEREEAAASGLGLLTPEDLAIAEHARRIGEPGALLAEVLAVAFARLGIEPGRVALGGRWPAGELTQAITILTGVGWSFVPAGRALRRLRKRKSEQEMASVRRVAAATCEIFRSLARLLAAAEDRDGELFLDGDRLRIARLRCEVAFGCAAADLSQPRAAILAPGEEGGVPHNTGSNERVLRAGEALVVDLFPRSELFADCTRTFCVGVPGADLARAHADVRAALELAHASCGPGARGWEMQRRVCALLAERGWPTPVTSPGTLRGYVHNLGHGVGYELHELPSFREDAEPEEGLLEAGDLVTLEPGIYEPGAGGYGVRLEDLVLVTESGSENLTPLPLELDPRAW